MRVSFGKKPLIYPQPVLIIGTYNEDGSVNAMNAAWCGVGDDHQVFLCLSPNHKTVENILKRKAFTVQVATEDTAVPSDYVGIVSGNNEKDKFKKSGLSAEKSQVVDAPILTDYPISIECSLISYEKEHCHCFGEIQNVTVDEKVLTDKKIDVNKLKPLAFDIDNGAYLSFSRTFAKAFDIGKKLK